MREVSRAAWRLQHAATEEMTEPDGTLLMAQFLRWLAERPRTYTDVMDAWRSAHRVRANRCGRTRGAISTDILHFSARVLVDQSARVVKGSESDPGHRFADLLPRRAIPGCPSFAAGRTGPRGSDRSRRRNGGQHSTVTRPRRLPGTSRTMPIGWHQRDPARGGP